MTGVPAAIASTATMPKSSIGGKTNSEARAIERVDHGVALAREHRHRHFRLRAARSQLALERTETGDHDGAVEGLADPDHQVEVLVEDEP